MGISEILDLVGKGIVNNIITAVIVGFGIYWQSGKLSSDNKAEFEKFKNDIVKLVNEIIKDKLEEIKSVVNKHDIHFLNDEVKFRDIQVSLQLIQDQNKEQYDYLKLHEKKIGMYEDTESLLKEVRETVRHSLEVLPCDDRKIASEYLYCIAGKVCEMIKNIQATSLQSLTRLEFDAFMANSLRECQIKYEQLFGSDNLNKYFNKTLPIYQYKEELFDILDDKTVNNIDRRFRTLTIKWLEELCVNFIRVNYIR